ncbi:DUF5348 domain-containing protein [Microaerobacter geothermalis]|uniref:DUF5348 domain-containing protein n=1 Tax=Microaerobacter geothermalis TaxID=674972 RepID=UPI001F3AEA09|nr:DUF5348 domain-containing protein [Microaerobacter geothermalis]MCF6094014.1 DUF5348 domain-containing protein [Microaerobacter geothermalis]
MDITHDLIYCEETDRWEAYSQNEYCFDMYCGELLSIRIGEDFLSCRLELDTQWYVLFGHTTFEFTKFYLHPNERYTVIID